MALTNMVEKFESNSSINCMTGAIMTQPDMVQKYPFGISRLFRKLEFMEYAQAFLAGRSYASDINAIYTISGAFSGFRKSALLKSQLYNTNTLAEDTQITCQMRYLQEEHIDICEKAIFLAEPIENLDKLYTQRQRWQRGSLEVSKMFILGKMKVRKMFTDVNVKTLMYDRYLCISQNGMVFGADLPDVYRIFHKNGVVCHHVSLWIVCGLRVLLLFCYIRFSVGA